MIEPRPLARAPLREAILDLRLDVRGERSKDLDWLSTVRSNIAGEYPKAEEVSRLASVSNGGAGVPFFGPPGEPGTLLCRSRDDRQAVQFSAAGFSFSRLNPYESWERLRDEAARLWTIYSAVTRPDSVRRVSLRYINEFRLAAGRAPDEYVGTAFVPTPPGLKVQVGGFLSRLLLRERAGGPLAWITQWLPDADSPDDSPRLILDIDAYRDFPQGIDVEQAWRCLEELRDLKNRLFFSSITEEALREFV